MIRRLHLITDDGILGRGDFLETAFRLFDRAGQRFGLHLRGPGSSGRKLYELGAELAAAAQGCGGQLLVNDRVDVALALRAQGVHLGQRSMGPSDARRLLGADPLLGLSIHSLEECPSSGREGLDYLIAGSVFATASHPGAAPAGLAWLRSLRECVDLPVVAIGGITPERVVGVLAAGADGVAVRGGVWDAPDPAAAVDRYLEALHAYGEENDGR